MRVSSKQVHDAYKFQKSSSAQSDSSSKKSTLPKLEKKDRVENKKGPSFADVLHSFDEKH